jgi:hypothetical protein
MARLTVMYREREREMRNAYSTLFGKSEGKKEATPKA